MDQFILVSKQEQGHTSSSAIGMLCRKLAAQGSSGMPMPMHACYRKFVQGRYVSEIRIKLTHASCRAEMVVSVGEHTDPSSVFVQCVHVWQSSLEGR